MDPLQNFKADQRAPAFLITIDTEGDNAWSRPRVSTTRNSHYLSRFQSLCERFGLRPTYLTNYEMARCPTYQAFARDVLRRNTGEVGMHLHAWDSPPIVPLTADDSAHHPYLFEFPETLVRAKIAALTDLLETTFDRKMVSHRAGRWGIHPTYARTLVDYGYLVDCSVTPRLSWVDSKGDPLGAGGPDFTEYPDEAYFLDLNDLALPGDSPLLEVPLTVMGPDNDAMARLHARFREGPRFVRAALCRLTPRIRKLVPNGQNLRHLLQIVSRAAHEGRAYVEFALHSSELMPGGSPRFVDERQMETLYEHLEQLFEFAGKWFVGATLREFRDGHLASCRRQGANDSERPRQNPCPELVPAD